MSFTPANLFDPLVVRGLTLKNRIAVSPMCQYSSENGKATDWHLVHLGSRAAGGAGLVMVEATAVEAAGRISPDDMGIWSDEHIEPLVPITRFVQAQGAKAGLQLAHAGRKASTASPWKGHKPLTPGQGGWEVVGPSAIPFSEGYPVPRPLDRQGIELIVNAFADGARRGLAAGFDLLEIHAAHGYLLHSFLSPLSNTRNDEYGGSLENRMRLTLEVISAIRKVIPEAMPLFLRISSTDWVPGGWDIEQSVELSRQAKQAGVDLVDCSSGALVASAHISVGPGYQVPFAQTVKQEAGIMTGAVGMITGARQADEIISAGKADLVFLARAMLRDPYWALKAAQELNVEVTWPVQYARAR